MALYNDQPFASCLLCFRKDIGMKRLGWLVCLAMLAVAVPSGAQDRATKVRSDRERVEADGFWIYNDFARGIAEAKKTGKPLLIVFRCIPCEACAQLDEQVVERNKHVQELLDHFVCVRIVHANGMDLSLFQFDYDQSWAAFFLNADLTIYGRYGTRSHQTESDNDVSLEGFAKALAAALDLHEHYPKNKQALVGKRGPDSEIKVPEEFPSLSGKYSSKLDYEGKVVQSCIHCHQVGEALRQYNRGNGKPIPEKVLYPYPNPKTLGLVLDPKENATVKSVTKGSSAEKDGFRVGDEIVSLAGQPILSIADIQWLLHNAGETGALRADVERDGKTIALTLTLERGWRQRGDISWRATSWDLRRMGTGGLLLEDLPDADRRKAGLAESNLALRIKHVGEYGAHAVAKQAGFKTGDIVISVDDHTQRMTESDLLAYMVNQKRPGDRVPFTVLRNGEKINLSLPTQ
jgi:serine protease Do